MGSSPPWFYYLLLLVVVCSLETISTYANHTCNIFKGKWVYEEKYSQPYNYTSCPFIRPLFDCERHGRPDSSYLKFRWQPHSCNLPTFDAYEFLRRFQGKKIMFVGDSLMLNQWQSLMCLIHSAVPQHNYTLIQHHPVYIFTIQDYDIEIMMQWHQFLVEIEKESNGRALKLDYIKGDEWRGVDVLVFDTYHWWYYKKPNQPWDYMEVKGKRYSNLNRTVAMKIALENWERWIGRNTNRTKTQVFYQGISPSHYHGEEWGRPMVKGCGTSKVAIPGDGRGLKKNPAVEMVKGVLKHMKHPVHFLDIWKLSLLRPDAHPSIYGAAARPPNGTGIDCTHWCLPGLPDTWNQLLYTVLLNSS